MSSVCSLVPAGVFWIIWVLSSLSSSSIAGISSDIPVVESKFSFFSLSLLSCSASVSFCIILCQVVGYFLQPV